MSTKVKEKLESHFLDERLVNTTSRQATKKERWEVRLSFLQLLISWGLVTAAMVGVFFFGLVAGQEEGLRQALETQSQQNVRLPVNVDTHEEALEESESITPLAAKELALSKEDTEIVTESEGVVEEEFDFRPSRVLQETPKPQAPPPATGFVAKEAQSPAAPPAAGWYVQVAAVEGQAEAKRINNDLGKHDFSTYTQDALVNKIKYSRVLVGPYQERGQAQAALTKIRQLQVVRGEPFLRKIN
jgi:cell division septation protein DedD